MDTIKNRHDDTELRRRAEMGLETAAYRVEALADMSPEKVTTLIHELQVHQIELTMQNEELRRIQGELENERDRYSELYNFAPSGYVTLSDKGMILKANLTCESQFGHESSQLLGKPFSRFITEDSQNSYHSLLRDLLETRSPQTCDLKLNRKGVGPFHARLDGIVKESADDPTPCILIAVTNITDRKQAWESLEKSHEGLTRQVEEQTLSLKTVNEQLKPEIENPKRAHTSWRESEERYCSLVESTSNSLYLVDEECNYLFMTKKHRQRLGLVSTRVEGTAYAACHTKQETEAFRSNVKTVFETGRPLSYEYQSEQMGNYFVRTLSPVMDGETVKAVSVFSKNITRQKQAEVEISHNRFELAHLERLAAMGELTASLAHEINQPLTTILSNAQAALRFIHGNPPEIDEVHATLQDIIAADRRASEIIRHLRAFFKKGQLKKMPQAINKLINDAIALVKGDALLKKVSIEKSLGRQLPRVEGDRVDLQQVILNLILNASDSMREINHRPRRVVISTMRENASFLKIGIRDVGKGIDPDHLEAIFKPYFTTKKDGMGMGLAICRSIIDAHGGKIWAENNPDPGATFYFTLPITKED